MKKITLAIALLSIGVQAQTFPAPYCEMTDGNDVTVEEITSVAFAGTTITNTDTASVLVDDTDTVVTLNQNTSYTIAVAGNTADPSAVGFENDIVAFIDWNQNDILDDDGEIYAVGTLVNSDGNDGVVVTLDITVPTDAVLGTTRIRLTKTYQDAQSPAEVDPCGILFNPFGQGIFAGFGQALDFTLEVTGDLSVSAFELNALSVFPNPTASVLNINYKSDINAVRIFNPLGQEVYAQDVASALLKLDVSALTAGIYVVKLVSGNQEHSFRLLKQ